MNWKMLFVWCGLGLGASLKAQGNLQFNQVLLVDNQVQSVPAGKVWKVNSFLQANTTNTNSFNSTSCTSSGWHSPFLMNGNRHYSLSGIATGSGSVYTGIQNHFPFWAPAGTSFQTICPGDVLSIIEFNVIP